jgi:hypothetical protein
MNMYEAFGYLASLLVFLAFYMTAIVPLRAIALCSNVAFIVYGLGLDLVPVLALHLALLPVNAWRLWQVISSGTVVSEYASVRACGRCLMRFIEFRFTTGRTWRKRVGVGGT